MASIAVKRSARHDPTAGEARTRGRNLARGVRQLASDSDGRAFVATARSAGLVWVSIGQWNGDAFVVTTTGFNDQTWLDGSGLPHSEELRLTERFRRLDYGHMEVDYTFQDPKAFTRPWSTTVKFELQADTDLMDHQCENQKWPGTKE